ATDLVVTTDTNAAADVFVRDLAAGTTRLVSMNASHTGTGNGHSGLFAPPALSPSGRLVAFSSEASDLVSGDTNGQSDVFLHDLGTGRTTLISENLARTGSGNSGSSGAVISVDGRTVAFSSDASDLVPNDTNGTDTDVFVRDLTTATTTLVSVNAAGTAS